MKTIYIPPKMQEIWEEIEKAAKDESRGIGFFLCDFWERMKRRISEKKG
jgi:hypothetical protein